MGWWERSNRWVDANTLGLDALTAGLLALFCLPTATNFDGSSSSGVRFWAVAVIAPLVLRRTRPVASAVAVFAVGLAQVLAGYPLIFPADVAILVALYSVTVYAPVWAHRTAIAGALVGRWCWGSRSRCAATAPRSS